MGSPLSVLSPIRPALLAMKPRALFQASSLKGGVQEAQSVLNQLKGRPGVKVSDLAMWSHLQPTEKIRPTELAAKAKAPKHYAQRGATLKHDPNADVTDAAQDMIWGPELEAQRRASYLRALREMQADPTTHPLPRTMVDRLLRTDELNAAGWEDMARDVLERYHPEGEDFIYITALEDWMPTAYDLALQELGARTSESPFLPNFGGYQRQPAARALQDKGGEYFETVLRRAPSYERGLKKRLTPAEWSSYHFENPAQLGHVRGTVSPGGQKMLIEEIQSDPVEQLGDKYPGMENIYGKLGNMIIDRAAAADVPIVMVPDAKRIASVRGGDKSGFMEKLYNRELGKVLYDPLQELGVPVYSDDGWMNIELSPQFRERVRKGDVLQYKHGGLACLRK